MKDTKGTNTNTLFESGFKGLKNEQNKLGERTKRKKYECRGVLHTFLLGNIHENYRRNEDATQFIIHNS